LEERRHRLSPSAPLTRAPDGKAGQGRAGQGDRGW
jgi:hypothetical protein